MAKRATIADVAKKADVSVMTVSRVVRNDKHVSPATRERVAKIIAQLNYHPDFSARALSSHVTGNIGLLASNSYTRSGFYTDLTCALDKELSSKDYSVITSFHPHWGKKIPVLITQKKIDGLIIAGYDVEERIVDECLHNKIPVVIIDGLSFGQATVNIDFDYRAGLASAIAKLELLGHNRFAFVGNSSTNTGERMMMEALCELLDSSTDKTLKIVWTDKMPLSGQYADWHKTFADATAIICASDLLAAKVVDYAKESGISVPEDVSVIGCGDTELARFKHPHISSIAVDLTELARQTLECLFRLVNKQNVSLEKLDVTTRYIQRESTGPNMDVKRKEVIATVPGQMSESLTN